MLRNRITNKENGMNGALDKLNLVDSSMRKAAIVAGLGLLIMAILAPIANFGILPKLVIQGDAITTAKNILDSMTLFRQAICFFLIVAILDIIVAWALYIVFKPINKDVSAFAALLRIVYAGMFAISVNNLVNVTHLLSGTQYLNAIAPPQLCADVMISLDSFQSGWNIGMIIFGLYLLLLGYLIFKSCYFPKFLGILVFIASLGYLTDSFGKIISSDYKLTIASFTFIGEVLLIFWLFGKGIKGFVGKQTKVD
jgi:hypothetical protein